MEVGGGTEGRGVVGSDRTRDIHGCVQIEQTQCALVACGTE